MRVNLAFATATLGPRWKLVRNPGGACWIAVVATVALTEYGPVVQQGPDQFQKTLEAQLDDGSHMWDW